MRRATPVKCGRKTVGGDPTLVVDARPLSRYCMRMDVMDRMRAAAPISQRVRINCHLNKQVRRSSRFAVYHQTGMSGGDRLSRAVSIAVRDFSWFDGSSVWFRRAQAAIRYVPWMTAGEFVAQVQRRTHAKWIVKSHLHTVMLTLRPEEE